MKRPLNLNIPFSRYYVCLSVSLPFPEKEGHQLDAQWTGSTLGTLRIRVFNNIEPFLGGLDEQVRKRACFFYWMHCKVNHQTRIFAETWNRGYNTHTNEKNGRRLNFILAQKLMYGVIQAKIIRLTKQNRWSKTELRGGQSSWQDFGKRGDSGQIKGGGWSSSVILL